jgi:selenium-binding protein 1
MPLEVRFLHDPKATVGFVGCALFGKVFKFFKTYDDDDTDIDNTVGKWDAKKVIDIPAKKVEG